jgi:hypothetical protein
MTTKRKKIETEPEDTRTGPTPSFPDWMTAKLGRWVIARRSQPWVDRGFETFLSPQRYQKLQDEWAAIADWTEASDIYLEHEVGILSPGPGRDAARRELARRWLDLCRVRECLNPAHSSDGRCTFHRGDDEEDEETREEVDHAKSPPVRPSARTRRVR